MNQGPLAGLLDLPAVARVRRNHALEHATIQILSERNSALALMGRSSLWGFYIYGDMDTEDVLDEEWRSILTAVPTTSLRVPLQDSERSFPWADSLEIDGRAFWTACLVSPWLGLSGHWESSYPDRWGLSSRPA